MATIGDVAREAGVSRSTVSSVLTGRKYVSPETGAKVEAAVAKLQFSVNAGARALATSRTMALGVVVGFHEAEFSPALAAYLIALSEAAREQGYSVVLLTEPDGVEAVRRAISGCQVDGFVLLNVVDDDPRLEPINQASYPAVLLGMPQDNRGVDTVDLDFAAGAAMLVDHLADAGHREAGEAIDGGLGSVGVAVDEAFDGADADAVFGGEVLLAGTGVEVGDEFASVGGGEACAERAWRCWWVRDGGMFIGGVGGRRAGFGAASGQRAG